MFGFTSARRLKPHRLWQIRLPLENTAVSVFFEAESLTIWTLVSSECDKALDFSTNQKILHAVHCHGVDVTIIFIHYCKISLLCSKYNVCCRKPYKCHQEFSFSVLCGKTCWSVPATNPRGAFG